MRDGLSNIQEVKAANQTLSGDTPNNSQAFDVRGFNRARFTLQTNTVTDAGAAEGFAVKLQHSDTLVGTDFADVPAGQIIGTALAVTADADDDKIIGSLGYIGGKRYVRAVITGTTGTNAVVHMRAVLTTPHRAPVAATGAALATS